jgi:hypothetical protein
VQERNGALGRRKSLRMLFVGMVRLMTADKAIHELSSLLPAIIERSQ